MKTLVHRANERGHANHGWLDSHHSFSFASYYNPEKMGVGKLRVLNDDVVAPAGGFGTHPHDNMEIVSIPLSGSLEHKDSMGNKHIIHAGEIQAMSAGTGITHSEYNHSDKDEVNFLQIWVMPKLHGIEPRYDQKNFSLAERNNSWQCVVSPLESDPANNKGCENSVQINQDSWFSMANIDGDRSLEYTNHLAGNICYVFVIAGEINIAGTTLGRRDAMAISDSDQFNIDASADSEVLVIEIPAQ